MRPAHLLLLLATGLMALPAAALSAAEPEARRRPSQDEEKQRAQEERAVKQSLAKSIPELKLEHVPLADALENVRDLSGANLHVNWRALEAVNITRETPVSLNLENVPLRQALRLLLTDASAEGLLTFHVDGNVVEITTRELSDQKMFLKVYPIQDLILVVPNFNNPPPLNINQVGTQTGRGGGGGQSVFSGATGTNEEGLTERQRGEQLVQMIKETVQPDIWRDNGGTATIRFYNGNLIVRAPRSVHEALGGMK